MRKQFKLEQIVVSFLKTGYFIPVKRSLRLLLMVWPPDLMWNLIRTTVICLDAWIIFFYMVISKTWSVTTILIMRTCHSSHDEIIDAELFFQMVMIVFHWCYFGLWYCKIIVLVFFFIHAVLIVFHWCRWSFCYLTLQNYKPNFSFLPCLDHFCSKNHGNNVSISSQWLSRFYYYNISYASWGFLANLMMSWDQRQIQRT